MLKNYTVYVYMEVPAPGGYESTLARQTWSGKP